MTDTIESRFALSSKETFFQMRADQKAIMTNSRTNKISIEYNVALDTWYAAKPQDTKGLLGRTVQADLTEWRKMKPEAPWTLVASARSMNIVYGMLRGHAYRDIEKTYREGNGPSIGAIQDVLYHYDIDAEAFHEACGAIDYE